MDISKTTWTNSEKKVNISFPIAKVNKEKRMVSGFASLDNIDRHGDIVTSDASQKAFDRFRGNLREMHQPIAVGKVVSFTSKEFVDPESNQTYKGVYVDAYISKGAQDTWEKVLDGTLTGFSIGGNIVEASYEPGDTEDNRVIKDYELMELSLVDNPANPLANIFSIQKNADGGQTMKGMAADTQVENVFYCLDDQIAATSSQETLNCVSCGDQMKNIGWVEKSDVQKGDSIMKAVTSYFAKDDAPGPDHAATTQDSDSVTSQDTINLYPDQGKIKTGIPTTKNVDGDEENTLNKGGNEEMADETTNEVEEATPVEIVEEFAEAPEAVDGDSVEKAATVSEVPVDELDFVKMVDTLKTDVTASIEKNYADHAATVSDMYAAVDAIKKSIDDFGGKHSDLTNNVADVVKRLDTLEKRIDAYESDTAVQKSGAVENTVADETKITKSIWQGHFLGAQNL